MPIFDRRTPEQKATDEARRTAERTEEEARRTAVQAEARQREVIEQERARRVRSAELAIADYRLDAVPKWEYCHISPYLRKHDWLFIYNGVEYPYKEIDRVMSEMGSEGWEMCGDATYVVCLGTSSYTDAEVIYFKRPVPPVPPALAQALREAEAYGSNKVNTEVPS